MRFVFRLASAALITAWSTLVFAQNPHPIALGANYTYVRTNVLPGCSCYSLNGGGAEAEFGQTQHLSLIAVLTVTHKGGITLDNYTLTQFTYTGGVRYWMTKPQSRIRPFGEVSLGGASTLGTLSPSRSGVGGSSNAFALQPGGGIALRLGSRFSVVPIEADYLMTTFNNNANNRQNDLRLSAGILLRLRQ